MNKSEQAVLQSKLIEIQEALIGEKIVFIGFDAHDSCLFGLTIETEYIKININVATDCCQFIACEIDNKK